jgi:hypothetical protein
VQAPRRRAGRGSIDEDLRMRFRSTIELGGKTATGFAVPDHIVESLGSGKRPKVTITINGFSYRTTIAPMGGRSMVPLAAERREAAGVAAGDEVDVDIELDVAPREVVVPEDLAAALDAHPAARARFDAMSYTHRKEHVRAIEDAKTATTRQRRIDKAIEALGSR